MGTKNNPGQFDCYTNAHPDEPMFVLLGRDRYASVLVRLWAALRAGDSIDQRDRDQIQEADACSRAMAQWCSDIGKIPIDETRLRVLRESEQHRRLLHFARCCADQSKESGTRIAALYAISGELGDILQGMRDAAKVDRRDDHR